MSCRGYKHTPKALEKIRLASLGNQYAKGKPAWNRGLKGIYRHTKETRKKLSLKSKGRIHSIESRKKISDKLKGRKFSEEHKQKLRISKIGKKHTVEQNKKQSERTKGSNANNWKGGLTPKNVIIRNSLEMKLWKKACLERDNYTCQKTRQIGGKLIIHHINNFADFPELRTSIKNGITLSKESHDLFHKIYGKRNNTKEQLLEFLKN